MADDQNDEVARTLCEMQKHVCHVGDVGVTASVAAVTDESWAVSENGAEDGRGEPAQTVMMIEWDDSDRYCESPLPDGWAVTWHESGIPLYLHESTGVCTLGRPYVISQRDTETTHDVPISAVPCLHYREVKRSKTCVVSPAANSGTGAVPTPEVSQGAHGEHHYSKITTEQDQQDAHALHDETTVSNTSILTAPAGIGTPQATVGSFLDSRFMDIDDILRILAETPALPRVPANLGTNCWFVVANDKNNERRARGRKSQFYDGRLWRSRGASTNKTYFLLDDNGKAKCTLTTHEGQFCVAKHSASRSKRQPLERQPSPEELLVVYRYYAREKDDPSLQRRVTWVSDCPAALDQCILSKALYEYKYV